MKRRLAELIDGINTVAGAGPELGAALKRWPAGLEMPPQATLVRPPAPAVQWQIDVNPRRRSRQYCGW